MKIPTDMHTWVWALASPEMLGAGVREAFAEDPFTASVAIWWELIAKSRKPCALLADLVWD